MMPFALEIGLALLMLLVFLAGLAGGDAGRRWTGPLTIGGLSLLIALSLVPVAPPLVDDALLAQDELTRFAQRLFLLSTLIAVLASSTATDETRTRRATEYHLLVLASLLGMMVLAGARDLILLFVAFELMSIPLYVLSGFQKREPIAVEAALKFFLVGTVSSAIMAYGISFVYGAAGTTALVAVGPALDAREPLVLLGLLALLAGFGFKIAAFPFHMWVPDTYEAAATPFVAWLSVAPKAAGFVALFRVYLEGGGERGAGWVPLVAALAALTIVAGNFMALPQENAKRLFAYSGIAHIGYMLVGLAAASPAGTAMVLFYLAAYTLGNMGAFLVIEALAISGGSTRVSAFRGLAQRSPLLALTMLLFLLSLGGIPFVAGFWAKLYVLLSAAEAGLYWLVFLGAVLTVVALYYYLGVAREMYVEAPLDRARVRVPPTLAVSLALCAAGVVALGVYPGPLVLAALRVSAPLF
jgi:NADH-quinone oxidoreductase subunit N